MTSTNVSSAVGKSSREGFGSVTPYLIVEKIDPFVEFLSKAFGSKETLREQGKGGGWHCEVQIGDGDVGGCIMIGGDQPSGGKTLPATLFLYVQDVDEVFKAAIAAGAMEEMAPMDDFAGENARGASIVDPFGFTWYFACGGP